MRAHAELRTAPCHPPKTTACSDLLPPKPHRRCHGSGSPRARRSRKPLRALARSSQTGPSPEKGARHQDSTTARQTQQPLRRHPPTPSRIASQRLCAEALAPVWASKRNDIKGMICEARHTGTRLKGRLPTSGKSRCATGGSTNQRHSQGMSGRSREAISEARRRATSGQQVRARRWRGPQASAQG